jgi:tetratricopeptide (TPR) repeat protein
MTLWRRFQDWREQRSTVKELKALRRADERVLQGDALNPLYLATLALDRGELATAAARWEVARERMPNFIYESEYSLPILLALKRYDEAEALMREGKLRRPRDPRWLMGIAEISEHKGDFAEAAQRWRAARAGGNLSNIPWIRESVCLRALGRLDEAEQACRALLRRVPHDLAAMAECAKISDERKDWPNSEARWREIADRHNTGFAFSGVARALVELGRSDEAEAVLEGAHAVFPADLDIGITRSHLAERRGDLTAACERWKDLQRVAPYFQPGYSGRAQCLSDSGRHAEADDVMRAAIEQFPDKSGLLVEFANFAHRRGDWPEAASRWEVLRTRFPDREEGYTAGRDALIAAGRHDEAAALRSGP